MKTKQVVVGAGGVKVVDVEYTAPQAPALKLGAFEREQ